MNNRFVAVVMAACSMASSASAESASVIADKELRIVVGYAAGGGYDTYARLVARHLGQQIGERTNIVVQNMPGGDGLTAANYMAQVAPRDGSAIGLTNRNFAVAPLLGILSKASVKYDPKAFNWVANLNSEVSVFIVRGDRNVASIADLTARPLRLGATGLTANNAIYPNVVNNLLGSRMSVVTGYPGTNHVILALERGEVDGIGGFSWTGLQAQRPGWIKDRIVVPVLQIGVSNISDLDAVPSLLSLARNNDDREALELIMAPEEMGRPFFLPPQTPAEVVYKTRVAFSKMAQNPDFLAAASKAGLDIKFTNGHDVQKYVERLNSAPDHVVDLAKQLMRRVQ